MTRFAIDRKNRDRKGGHSTTALSSSQWESDVLDPGTRKRFKRMGTKLLRRQHSKAINEGMALMQQEQEDRIAAYWGIEQELDYYSSQNLKENNEEFPEYTDDDYWDYYDHYDNGPCYGMEDDYSFSSLRDDCSYRDRSNASLLDRNTVEDLANEVQRGMVKLDLEVIENRDAGKSLGQLLRERLSRPF